MSQLRSEALSANRRTLDENVDGSLEIIEIELSADGKKGTGQLIAAAKARSYRRLPWPIAQSLLESSAIHVFPMAYLDHEDHQGFVFDRVDDPIGPLTHSISSLTRKFSTAGRPGIVGRWPGIVGQ